MITAMTGTEKQIARQQELINLYRGLTHAYVMNNLPSIGWLRGEVARLEEDLEGAGYLEESRRELKSRFETLRDSVAAFGKEFERVLGK